MDEQYNDTYFSLYPNPNNGAMQIEYEIPVTEAGMPTCPIGRVEIYDVLGKKLFNQSLFAGKNTFAISGNILDKGIYFYQAIIGNKRIAADKLVVIK